MIKQLLTPIAVCVAGLTMASFAYADDGVAVTYDSAITGQYSPTPAAALNIAPSSASGPFIANTVYTFTCKLINNNQPNGNSSGGIYVESASLSGGRFVSPQIQVDGTTVATSYLTPFVLPIPKPTEQYVTLTMTGYFTNTMPLGSDMDVVLDVQGLADSNGKPIQQSGSDIIVRSCTVTTGS